MEVPVMGYLSRVQVIERRNGSRQFYVMCPAPLAEALEMQKGEQIDWVIHEHGLEAHATLFSRPTSRVVA